MIINELWTSEYSNYEAYYYEPDTGYAYNFSNKYDSKYAICVYDGITSISY